MKRASICIGWGYLTSLILPLWRWWRQEHYEP